MSPLTDQDVQAVWPAGFVRQRELSPPGMGERRFLAIDGRTTSDRPVDRIVRLGRIADSESVDRLNQLREQSGPHLSIPLEMKVEAGFGILITEPFELTLAERLSEEPLNSEDVTRFVAEIGDALAALHERRMTCDTLRPENIGLRRRDEGGWTAQLIAGSLGGEETLADGFAYEAILPPEWKGTAQVATPPTDFFRLGILACGMLLGRLLQRQASESFAESPVRSLLDRLDSAAVSPDLTWALRELLADEPDRRPKSGTEFLHRLERRRKRWLHRLFWTGLALTGFSCVVLASAVVQSRSAVESTRVTAETFRMEWESERKHLEDLQAESHSERRNHVSEVHRLQQEALNGAKALYDLRNKIKIVVENDRISAHDKVVEIQRIVGTTLTPNSPEEIAQKAWRAFWRGQSVTPAGIRKLRETPERIEATGAAHTLIITWIGTVGRLYDQSSPWIENPLVERARVLEDELRRAAATPWSVDATSKAERVLRSHEEGGHIWRTAAETEGLNWDEFKKRVATAAKAHAPKEGEPSVESIVSGWVSRLETHGPKWTVQLLSGQIEKPLEGWLPSRFLVLGDTPGMAVSWSDLARHDYADGPENRIEFVWKPGDPESFTARLLEDDQRYFSRRDTIGGQTFSGPVALWRMGASGEIRDAKSGLVLRVHVLDLPGPPRAVDEAVPSVP